jgi:hypothetical protein
MVVLNTAALWQTGLEPAPVCLMRMPSPVCSRSTIYNQEHCSLSIVNSIAAYNKETTCVTECI